MCGNENGPRCMSYSGGRCALSGDFGATLGYRPIVCRVHLSPI